MNLARHIMVREWIALLITGGFVVATASNLDVANEVFVAARDYVVAAFDWFFTGLASVALLAVAWIGADPRFNVRLGQDHERPEFSKLAWFAMLFSAGLASGVLYWATAEPIIHFQGNPHLAMEGASPLSERAAQTAVTLTIFHWGLHGWGFYVLTGLAIAYFSFRRGLPLALRSALYPLLGERVHGWPGYLVDLIGVIGTVFGVATSIGLAVAGMNAAMGELIGIEINVTNQLVIIGLVSVLGVLSVISGISQGIRRLSELNVYLSAALLIAVLIIGPTGYLLGFVLSS
ncbi:MAG: BCCT family transporter, partial [Gammaproteobacteria bacterium]|nr:BCCT family transporter [Gammaproteobacteria bacterium]